MQQTLSKKNEGDYPYAADGKLTIKVVTKEKSVPFRFEGLESIDGVTYARSPERQRSITSIKKNP